MALRNRSSAVQILALVREAVEPGLLEGRAAMKHVGPPPTWDCKAACAICGSSRVIDNAILALHGEGELDLNLMKRVILTPLFRLHQVSEERR